MESLISAFARDWQSELEKIKRDILKVFSNFNNSTKVLNLAVEKLVESYTIFTKIVEKYYPNTTNNNSNQNDAATVKEGLVSLNDLKEYVIHLCVVKP